MSRRHPGAALLAVLLVALCLTGTASAAEQDPRVEARAWTLIDARSGDVLTSHAAARHLPIASTTKLMTAYVALQELRLKRIVRAAPYEPIYGESLLGLRAGQRVSVHDLLYGLLLRSGNDSAHDLALAAAGSQSRFVAEMNRRAAALGLADTHYANPIGLDQRGNFSSARDLATLTQRLQRIPVFARIVDSRTAVLRSLRPPRRIENSNDLLFMEPWATGVKTGHTFDAAYVLVASGQRKGVKLISVAIGAPSEEARYRANLDLLEYGFSQYRRRRPIRAGEEPCQPRNPLLRWRTAPACRARGHGRPAAWPAARGRGPRPGRGRGTDPARRQARDGGGHGRRSSSRHRAAAGRAGDRRGEQLRPCAHLSR